MNGLGPLTWETIKSSPEKACLLRSPQVLGFCSILYYVHLCAAVQYIFVRPPLEVAIPAMEFWSTICDEALSISLNAADNFVDVPHPP